MRISIGGTDNIEKDFKLTLQPVYNDFNSVTIAGGNDIRIETDTFFDPEDHPVTFDTYVKMYGFIRSSSEDNGFLFFYDFFKVELKKIIQGKEEIKRYYKSRNMIDRMETVRHSFLYLMEYTLIEHKMQKVTIEEFFRETDYDLKEFSKL